MRARASDYGRGGRRTWKHYGVQWTRVCCLRVHTRADLAVHLRRCVFDRSAMPCLSH